MNKARSAKFWERHRESVLRKHNGCVPVVVCGFFAAGVPHVWALTVKIESESGSDTCGRTACCVSGFRTVSKCCESSVLLPMGVPGGWEGVTRIDFA